MADAIRMVEYFYVTVPNKPGEGARLLDTLRHEGVNLLAFSAFPEGRKTQADFIPEDPATFRKVAKKAKWKVVGPRHCFLIKGEERIGACADLVVRLASAKINIIALDAVTVDRQYGAILWVARKDLKKAAKALGAEAAARAGAPARAIALPGVAVPV
jgi:hypothetical protein